MRKTHILAVMISFSMFFSCKKDKDVDEIVEKGTSVTFGKVKEVKDLYAPSAEGHNGNTGEFVKFNFLTGETKSDKEWHIAFRTTTILINGGSQKTTNEPQRTGNVSAYIEENKFEDVTEIYENKLKQDSPSSLAILKGSGNGWYNYTGAPKHNIVPIPGRVLIFKIDNNKYVKMEILSYYKGALPPKSQDPNSKYYTFRYSISE